MKTTESNHNLNDIIFGYSRKIEEVKKFCEVDVDKVKYLQAMLTLVYFAEKCFHENDRVEICFAFRELFKVAL